MTTKTASKSSQKRTSNILVNGILILICLLWTIPTIGVLVTSFRDSRDIFTTGWWTVLPHMGLIDTGEITINPDVDVNGPIVIDGVSHTFAEWRQGVTMPDGRKITWFGNKRTRKLEVQESKFIWFGTNLTLDNYKNVLTGQDISYKDGEGNTIVRKGNNFMQLSKLNCGRCSGHHYPHPHCGFCCLRFCLDQLPRQEILLHCGGSLAGRSSATGTCPNPARLHEAWIEWNVHGHVAGAYRLWSAVGYLFDV